MGSGRISPGAIGCRSLSSGSASIPMFRSRNMDKSASIAIFVSSLDAGTGISVSR